MLIRFTVQGKPQPQGSTRAFMPKGARFPIITSDNTKLKPWRQDIASQALIAMHESGCSMNDGPIHVECSFFFLKPKSTKKSITYKITKPDIDKLQRAIYDGITGICIRDDSQIVSNVNTKSFCEDNERVEVEIRSVAERFI